MSDPKQPLSREDVDAAGLPDWRLLEDGLYARFQTGSFVAGTQLIDRICDAAEEVDHHPDVDLRYPFVQIRLISHDVGAVTSRDTGLARTISELASGTEVTTDRISP